MFFHSGIHMACRHTNVCVIRIGVMYVLFAMYVLLHWYDDARYGYQSERTLTLKKHKIGNPRSY